MFPVENVNVFYISSTGVTEANKFIIFSFPQAKRASSSNRSWILLKKPSRNSRHRTYSLPARFESHPSFKNQEVEDDEVFTKKTVSSSDDQLSGNSKIVSNHRNQQRLSRSLSNLNGNLYRPALKTSKKKKESKGKVNERKLTSKKKGSLNRVRISPCKSLAGAGVTLYIDGYQLSYFIEEMKRSQAFRKAFIHRWTVDRLSNQDQHSAPAIKMNDAVQRGNNLVVLIALMNAPSSEVLDSLGNKMVNSNILYRRSLEHALSWLSTLGGAFSALGDLSPAWAEEAGHVSLTQLRIAMKLGDPGIQSRCRLFAAISLLQKGYLRSCRDIVEREYKYAISLPDGADPRLRKMCLGIWAKLQHQWKLTKLASGGKDNLRLNSTENGLQYILSNTKYWNMYNLEENRKVMKIQ